MTISQKGMRHFRRIVLSWFFFQYNFSTKLTISQKIKIIKIGKLILNRFSSLRIFHVNMASSEVGGSLHILSWETSTRRNVVLCMAQWFQVNSSLTIRCFNIAENEFECRNVHMHYARTHKNFCMYGAASAQIIIFLESLAWTIPTSNGNHVCKLWITISFLWFVWLNII